MSLPKFETIVIDLDSHEDVVFDAFISQITSEDLFLGAEWYVQERIPNSSVYTFSQMPGGLMAHVIGLTLMAGMESQTGGISSLLFRLMGHYQFDADTVPPRLLAREAIMLQVRLSAMLSDLEKITLIGRSHLEPSIIAAAGGLALPEEAYSLTNVQLDEVLLR